jgi:hypothetical protein
MGTGRTGSGARTLLRADVNRQDGGRVRLVKRQHCETALAGKPFDWKLDQRYALKHRVMDSDITAFIDGQLVFEVRDATASQMRGRRRTDRRYRFDFMRGRARGTCLRCRRSRPLRKGDRRVDIGRPAPLRGN